MSSVQTATWSTTHTMLHTVQSRAHRDFPAVKDVVDFVLALVMLVVAAPLMLILAALVKLTSRGPALYSQVRVGQDGRLFRMYKLRSMRQNCEKKTGPVWAKKNDPRITPLGRFLRKSHLDELPQLVNVLKGEMSLVGPRPERPAFVEDFCERFPRYRSRLAVKPGVTGLAQVKLPYDETIDGVKHKLAYDLMYIRRMCWMIDISILFRTLGKLTGRGAH